MLKSLGSLVFSSFFLSVPVLADVPVRLSAIPGAEGCSQDLTLVVLSVDTGEATKHSVPSAATRVTISSDAARRTARIESEHCWSEEVEMDSTGETALRIYKAVALRGTFEVEENQFPGQVEGVVFRAPESGAHGLSVSDSGHDVACRIEKAAWQCNVPADVPFDLVLRPRGFAPVYFWGLVSSETFELEARRLRAGASVAGWVEDPDGKPIHGATVSIAPAVQAIADGPRALARNAKSLTNRRGFFQLTGLAEGEYRIVSAAEGLSAAVLPVVNLAAGESLLWPRQVTHRPYAQLALRLSPATDAEGRPWTVALTEVTPLVTPPPPPVRRQATSDGFWEAKSLRADLHRVSIEDAGQSVIQTLVVDLSKGDGVSLSVHITRRMVRGRLRFGDDPLSGTIRFSTMTGRSARAEADDEGRFEVSFPAPGQWTPIVFPKGPAGPRITADPLNVPDTEEDQVIDITLGGSRVRGKVVDRDGETQKAAVHLARDGNLVAQQLTEDDGTFDFIGIRPGGYVLDAQGETGTARAPATHVGEDETAELTLRLQPYSRISTVVLTPSGAPASGALVRVSTDRGLSWSDLHTRVDGSFEYYLQEGTPSLFAIVLTHSYPALFVELTPRSPSTLMLQARGGMLRARFPSHVGRNGVIAPLRMFLMPPGFQGLYNGAAYLEPGTYVVCPALLPGRNCQQVDINIGSDKILDRPKERTP